MKRPYSAPAAEEARRAEANEQKQRWLAVEQWAEDIAEAQPPLPPDQYDTVSRTLAAAARPAGDAP